MTSSTAEGQSQAAEPPIQVLRQRVHQLVDTVHTTQRRCDELSRQDAAGRSQQQALAAQLTALTQERDRLSTERDALAASQQELGSQRNGLQAERDALQAERDALSTKLQTLSSQRDGLQQERDQLSTERDALAASMQALDSERSNLQAERNALQQQCVAFQAERDSLQAERDDLSSRLLRLTSQFQELDSQRQELGGQLEALIAQRDRLQQELNQQNYERDALTERLQEQKSHNHELQKKSENTIKRLAEQMSALEAKQTLLYKERDQLFRLTQPKPGVGDSQESGERLAVEEENLSPRDGGELLFIHNWRGRLASDKWESYFRHYERNLSPIRKSSGEVKILEIGVQNGGSLETWNHYFKGNARIIGIDIDPAAGFIDAGEGTQCLVGDATDSTWVKQQCESKGPFDVIIDDGSHVNSDVLKTFFITYPYLSPGGIYACEDLHAVYWHTHKGCLPKTGENAVSVFKEIADLVNLEHWQGLPDVLISEQIPLLSRHMSDSHIFSMIDLLTIESIEFCNSLVFIRKSSQGPCSLGQRVVRSGITTADSEILSLDSTRIST